MYRRMDFLHTTYPVSIYVIVIVLIIIFLVLLITNTIVCAALTLLSLTGCISIKPVFELIDYLISTLFETHIKKIKENVRESFVVGGNMNIKGQAIYSFHPHGVVCATAGMHLTTNTTAWPYKNIKMTVHKYLAEFPFIKDLFNKYIVSSRYNLMKNTLEEGKSLGVSLGGTAEISHLYKNKIVAVVKSRKGIFKMAIESGVQLVPVIVYGENDIFQQTYSFGLLERIAKVFKIKNIPCPSLESIIKWISVYYTPLDEKVCTYIGDPIEVGEARAATEKEIDDLREKYISALHDLYNKTKPAKYKGPLQII